MINSPSVFDGTKDRYMCADLIKIAARGLHSLLSTSH